MTKPKELDDILRSFDEYAAAAAAEMGELATVYFPEYVAKIRDRLIVSWAEYQDGTRKLTDQQIQDEIEQEALDLAGWGLFLYERHGKPATVDLFVQSFCLWMDIAEINE